ncbi:polyprenol reductase-like isoform X1 [Montipora capricornis]|uniref:polyprenol reductase-like isoform X1 n=1 Tax=Montipora capricornis TaxID=246305 RepID=UPI0035F11ED1
MDALYAVLVVLNVIAVGAYLLYVIKSYTPYWMHEIFEWGKTKPLIAGNSWMKVFHVPNRLFIHFYVIGSSMSCAFLVILVLHCFFGSTSIPQDLSEILDLHFTPSTDCFTVLLSLLLLLVQTCRRLFESLFVSVFTGKMNVAHYLLGVIYYILDATSLAAPLLQCSKRDEDWCHTCYSPFTTLRWYQYLAVIMFVWASWHQWNCHNILAKLRQSPGGQTVKVYRIPQGDWFKFVSSPHYLAEIMIYVSLFVFQKGCNIYFGLLLLFTIQNLSIGATVSHEWYKKKFKEYPNSRCRIFPFVY